MITWLFHPHIGGVEKHVLKVSAELVKRGHEVKVLTLRYDESLAEEDEINGVRVLRIGGKMFGMVPLARLLSGWVASHRASKLLTWANILHFHDHTPFVRWYLPRLVSGIRRPIFVTFHGFESERPGLKEKLERRFLHRIASGSVCVGGYIERHYGTRCDVVTIGGTDLPPHDSVIAKERRGLILGRLEDDVGIFKYLEVLRILKENHGKLVPVDVLGSGSRIAPAREYADCNDLNVRFHGAVTDVIPYLRKALFTFASSYLSMLEAMAHRSLVLATWMSELKRDYVRSLDSSEPIALVSDDANALAEELSAFLDKAGEKQKIIEAAYRFASEHTWEKVASLYLDLYSCKMSTGQQSN